MRLSRLIFPFAAADAKALRIPPITMANKVTFTRCRDLEGSSTTLETRLYA